MKENTMNEIRIHERDLPLAVVLIGERGTTIPYVAKPATKGLGVYLSAPEK